MSSMLGRRVRCRTTKFEGVVVKRMEALYGSAQVLVSGSDQGYRRDEWLEEAGVEVVGEAKLASVTAVSARPPSEPEVIR